MYYIRHREETHSRETNKHLVVGNTENDTVIKLTQELLAEGKIYGVEVNNQQRESKAIYSIEPIRDKVRRYLLFHIGVELLARKNNRYLFVNIVTSKQDRVERLTSIFKCERKIIRLGIESKMDVLEIDTIKPENIFAMYSMENIK